MEALRRQATKLREQLSRQQQVVLKHLGHVSGDTVITDEEQLQCHQKLKDLYTSTKAAKLLQRNIVRGLEGFTASGLKLLDIGRKLAEDSEKYGDKFPDLSLPLARAAHQFAASYKSVEDERKTLIGFIGEQVCKPLQAMIHSPPLEGARRLVSRYDKLCQEVEAQAADVLRRKSKLKESDISEESYMKLKNSESRLVELKLSMKVLGKEATSAMLKVEEQQQDITYQRLLALVEAERLYHRNALDILEKLYSEMIAEGEVTESSPKSLSIQKHEQTIPNSQEGTKLKPLEETKSNGSNDNRHQELLSQNDSYFLAKVVHTFDAQTDRELSLTVDDYLIVRQMDGRGWSEGECKGKAGWFPSAYVEKQDKVEASKLIMEPNSNHNSSLSN